MSQMYAPTREGKAQMFRDALAAARARGDANMVRNLKIELASLGEFETTEDATVLEMPTPDRPRRGRKPMPRCEHNMIAARCEICNEDVPA